MLKLSSSTAKTETATTAQQEAEQRHATKFAVAEQASVGLLLLQIFSGSPCKNWISGLNINLHGRGTKIY